MTPLLDRIKDLVSGTDLAKPEYRDALLSGINRAIIDLIPVNKVPTLQISADLDACANHGIGTLVRWLRNAARLTKEFPTGAAFQALFEEAQSMESAPPKQYRWLIPPPTASFADRSPVMAGVQKALGAESLDPGGPPTVAALVGLGGVGKTQMARRFAQLHRSRYQAGVWVDAQSSAGIVASLALNGKKLGVRLDKEQRVTAERVVDQVAEWSPWLVVFDNAESPESLAPWIERLATPGHVLITSRNVHWDGLAVPVQVPVWGEEESVGFLLARTGQDDVQSAKELARELGGLAVALEHAAGFMLAGDRPPLAEYLARWRDRLGKLPPRAEYPTSVAATLGLSIDALRAESAPAHDVLCLFAWLGPDGIPRDALLKPGAAKLPASIATAFADADQWSNVVEALVRYALVAREPERGPVSAYRVHRLVQQVMRHRMASEGTASAWLAEACALVERAHPPLLPKHWEVFSKLLPHARAIRAAVGSGDSPPTFGPMLERVALYLQQRGLYTEARDFQASALESDLRNLGSDHPAIADRRAKLASILSDLGEDQLARTHMQAALDAELARYPPDHPTVLDRRSDLGVILRRLKEYGEARRHMEIVLEAALDRFGPDHANVAITRSNLAVILLRSELPNEARLQAQQALDSDLRRLGPDDTDVATDRSNLAMVLIELGDHEEALTQLDLALESETHTFGKAHPTVAVTRLNRAKALLAKGDYQTALDEVDRALEVFRRALPDSHPHIGTATRRREEILARIST